MKLAFIGTHGVGKTTLCFELAARLKRLDFSVDLVKEVARDCPLPINQETSLAAQSWILHTQIARELAATPAHEVVVCDRSILDNYAYLVHRLGRQEELDPLVRRWISGYRLLVKVPRWRPPSFDGVRDVAPRFQASIDETLDELIESIGAPVFRLDPERPEFWADDVLRRLELPIRAEQVSLFPEDS